MVLSVKEKKENFKKMLLPAVQEVYAQLNKDFHEVKQSLKEGNQLPRINKLKEEYKVKTDEALLLALKPHPISITLAQAAMESSWGTSRFFKEGNNLFGIWSFNKNEPRIAAGGKRGEKTIWLKKYASVKDSVEDYYKNMGRSFAFKEFRQEKMLSNNPYILVTKLDKYSEKGSKYGEELTAMMSFNKFLNYDETFFAKPKKIENIIIESSKPEAIQDEMLKKDKTLLDTQEAEIIPQKELSIISKEKLPSLPKEPLPTLKEEELPLDTKELDKQKG